MQDMLSCAIKMDLGIRCSQIGHNKRLTDVKESLADAGVKGILATMAGLIQDFARFGKGSGPTAVVLKLFSCCLRMGAKVACPGNKQCSSLRTCRELKILKKSSIF